MSDRNETHRTGPDAGPPTPPSPSPEPAERLLRLAATCPRCGARPAMRVTDTMVHAMRNEDAGARIATYQCQRRGCGAVYDIPASACLRAS